MLENFEAYCLALDLEISNFELSLFKTWELNEKSNW